MDASKRVFIGIPCYDSAPAPTLEDYMRFAFHLGRRCRKYDFFLHIIDKAEQFRARNRMVEQAIAINAQYLLMLDDDMVIDTDNTVRQSDKYNFLIKFIKHIEDDPKIGMVGGLYYQRGGDHHVVAMKRHNGDYYWLRDEELTGGLQDVAVAGGGCILINMDIFNAVGSPWFEPEQQTNGPSRSTDIQLAEKCLASGYRVCLDSSIELGHVSSKRVIITSENRGENKATIKRLTNSAQNEWDAAGLLNLYKSDIHEYLGMTPEEIIDLAEKYNGDILSRIHKYSNPVDHYKNLPVNMQLARQYYYHGLPEYRLSQYLHPILGCVGSANVYGLDFGCGSSPIGFDLLMRGHKMDFVDVEGGGAWDFVKWRVKRRGLADRAGFEVAGPYDFILFMDVIEHLAGWEEILGELRGRLKPNGFFFMNYFENIDAGNPEHINMDKTAVHRWLVLNGMAPESLSRVTFGNFTMLTANVWRRVKWQ